MNIPLLTQIRDAIANDPDHFDMDTFASRTACGTTCCIAGYASVISGGALTFDADGFTFTRNGREVDPQADGQDMLGLSWREGVALFYASRWPAEYRTTEVRTSTALAVALLSEVIRRGEIWWAK